MRIAADSHTYVPSRPGLDNMFGGIITNRAMASRVSRLLSSAWLRRLAITGLVAGFSLFTFCLPAAEPSPSASPPTSVFDPTSAYREQQIEGWRVLVKIGRAHV